MVSVRCIVRIASSAAQKLGELVSMASMASRGVLRRSSCRARGNCTTATVTFTAIRLVAKWLAKEAASSNGNVRATVTQTWAQAWHVVLASRGTQNGVFVAEPLKDDTTATGRAMECV
jgi:hypothetical protein